MIRWRTLPTAAQCAARRNFASTTKAFEYRFASAEHLAAFRANPSRYVPQYGGYCAWAVSQGYTASGNPNNWRIVDGRLYLNYNDEIQTRWEQDIPGHITRANGNWPSVLEPLDHGLRCTNQSRTDWRAQIASTAIVSGSGSDDAA